MCCSFAFIVAGVLLRVFNRHSSGSKIAQPRNSWDRFRVSCWNLLKSLPLHGPASEVPRSAMRRQVALHISSAKRPEDFFLAKEGCVLPCGEEACAQSYTAAW